MTIDQFMKDPLFTYQDIILKKLTAVYSGRKSSHTQDWTRFSDLLIDKFAIHSGTLFHLFYGIIIHDDSTAGIRKAAFDPFTVNCLLRAILETYSTFNHIFVLPKDDEEKEFRFLLWQLDGLIEKGKFRIEKSDFDLSGSILGDDHKTIKALANRILNSQFARSLNQDQLNKLIRVNESIVTQANWKFLYENGKIKLLKIVNLVEFSCPTRAFYNLYRYNSIHTHSGYVSVQQFEAMRGKMVSEQYVNALIRMAIIVTIFLIKDICEIDENAAREYLKFSDEDRFNFDSINNAKGNKTTV